MAEVLVVDDETEVRTMISAILNQAGHKVASCATGLEALKKLGIQPDEVSVELPDLMVLDIMMPKTDGYMVADVIRNNPRTHDIPILVISALHELSRLFTTKIQVDGFLTKPFNPEDLIGNVAKLLNKRTAQS